MVTVIWKSAEHNGTNLGMSCTAPYVIVIDGASLLIIVEGYS